MTPIAKDFLGQASCAISITSMTGDSDVIEQLCYLASGLVDDAVKYGFAPSLEFTELRQGFTWEDEDSIEALGNAINALLD